LLAWGHAARAYLGRAEPTAELETALTMARRAIDQDGEDPWAHLAMGYVHMVSRRPQPAFSELKQTIELNSSFAFGHMILGSAYGYAGMVMRDCTSWRSPQGSAFATTFTRRRYPPPACAISCPSASHRVLRAQGSVAAAPFRDGLAHAGRGRGAGGRARSCRPRLGGSQAAAAQPDRRLGREIPSDRPRRGQGDVYRGIVQGRSPVRIMAGWASQPCTTDSVPLSLV